MVRTVGENGASRTRRQVAYGRRRLVAVLGALGVVGLVATFTHSSPGSGSVVPTIDRAHGALLPDLGVPPRYLALYRAAGRRYGLDWAHLAAVGALESDHGRSPLDGVRSGAGPAGASGPGQFLAATWARYGLDADGDGVRDPHEPTDAIFSMAGYLRASGAPENWAAALHAYNPSAEYVAAVRRAAAELRAREAVADPRLLLCPSVPPCAG